MKKTCLKIALCLLLIPSAQFFGQEIRSMSFQNQNIVDILMVLADIGKQSVIVDESVMGTATFHFTDSSFEDALYQFASACNLFIQRRNNAYFVSKVSIRMEGESIFISVEDTDIEMMIRSLSRAAGKTILYDQLPRQTISINSENISLMNLLEIVIMKYPEYSLVLENEAFYIRRTIETSPTSAGRLTSSSITERNGLYSMDIQRASFSQILIQLFRVGNREYSVLQRIDSSLDNLYFQDKTFDQMLRLVLEQANCDYMESSGIYYIFEVQRRDILKKLKDIMVIQLQHISVENAMTMLPNEYSASAFIKMDKTTNSAYLTGSTEEITPIANFLMLIDVPVEGKYYERFEIHYISVNDFITLLPQELTAASPMVIPGSNAFIVQTTYEQKKQFEDYINLVDKQNVGLPINLRYIKSEEIVQYLPPSVSREEIVVSSDPTLIFYKGTEEKQKQFLEHLKLIDQPKPQIRYHLLVIQYQRSNNLTWAKSLNIGRPARTETPFFSGVFTNLININFDIITELGYQFALQLNMQIGEDKAKVLADTTLNGISGQDIRFENTTTFRYRDTAIDPETGKPFYTGVTREITSGMVLGINGWVSGDGMITMNVNATVSKQSESGANTSASTNPPPTSERVVNTHVRTKSGTPIVIGGLLQVEKIESRRETPILSRIPLLGKLFQDIDIQDYTTEMVIYIVPYVHMGETQVLSVAARKEQYFKRYIMKDE
jgi:type II secretory pathway component GspD/PulD (secretin)